MLIVSPQILKSIAVAIWYSGSIVLAFKSASLLNEAFSIKPLKVWIITALISGILLGIVKWKYIFSKSAEKKIKRIENLKRATIWQVFETKFYIFLTAMIFLGSKLSEIASGNHTLLIAVSIIDISISTALFLSGIKFFKN
ncbi:hypothetical protein [Desulfurobacterium atlanticum]|uniref:Uncharacterized protein n=1 Tax=Desulfurobacterium atlanticum TaxID=240169 RepID=A0A238XK86_9BACT|nr:hypothetical protein [Desulfurobacterium atlanticum]SNR59415.1 hypothetical protein SAMN06265340_10166 [Desulfurobacterium atlanticum]